MTLGSTFHVIAKGSPRTLKNGTLASTCLVQDFSSGSYVFGCGLTYPYTPVQKKIYKY